MSERVARWLDRAAIADAGPPPAEAWDVIAERDRYRQALRGIFDAANLSDAALFHTVKHAEAVLGVEVRSS